MVIIIKQKKKKHKNEEDYVTDWMLQHLKKASFFRKLKIHFLFSIFLTSFKLQKQKAIKKIMF